MAFVMMMTMMMISKTADCGLRELAVKVNAPFPSLSLRGRLLTVILVSDRNTSTWKKDSSNCALNSRTLHTCALVFFDTECMVWRKYIRQP